MGARDRGGSLGEAMEARQAGRVDAVRLKDLERAGLGAGEVGRVIDARDRSATELGPQPVADEHSAGR